MDSFIRNFVLKYQRILKKTRPENLLKLLSAIEYTEAILEITAAKLFGQVFKWFIIVVTQLAKCIIRLQLLLIHKIGIQPVPSLFSLKGLLDDKKATQKKTENQPNKEGYFVLKSSGRVVRTIKNSPTILENRDWSVPVNQDALVTKKEDEDVDFDPTKNKMRFLAEMIFIIRPICHLSSMLLFKQKSWTQYLIALSMDTSSLFLMNGTAKLSKSQKEEMRRRTILFVHYLIRSPFYDLYSSSIINLVLSIFEQRIPGSKFLIKPIKEYIPYWQSIYNYCWTV
ncbi:unnamed protein product [Brachionus calyciflorus]|uniref:Peroxisomal membrane protein PEX16 n=1 Tax=Brachionus calyciflorus TaxID=104777 RepID=A0A813T3G6_9BILA|nr:unnamed protein product [Brachionus calyciflorus]